MTIIMMIRSVAQKGGHLGQLWRNQPGNDDRNDDGDDNNDQKCSSSGKRKINTANHTPASQFSVIDEVMMMMMIMMMDTWTHDNGEIDEDYSDVDDDGHVCCRGIRTPRTPPTLSWCRPRSSTLMAPRWGCGWWWWWRWGGLWCVWMTVDPI